MLSSSRVFMISTVCRPALSIAVLTGNCAERAGAWHGTLFSSSTPLTIGTAERHPTNRSNPCQKQQTPRQSSHLCARTDAKIYVSACDKRKTELAGCTMHLLS
jgi:hypothetical protein